MSNDSIHHHGLALDDAHREALPRRLRSSVSRSSRRIGSVLTTQSSFCSASCCSTTTSPGIRSMPFQGRGTRYRGSRRVRRMAEDSRCETSVRPSNGRTVMSNRCKRAGRGQLREEAERVERESGGDQNLVAGGCYSAARKSRSPDRVSDRASTPAASSTTANARKETALATGAPTVGLGRSGRLVHECDVDRELHEEGVDAAARREDERASSGEVARPRRPRLRVVRSNADSRCRATIADGGRCEESRSVDPAAAVENRGPGRLRIPWIAG